LTLRSIAFKTFNLTRSLNLEDVKICDCTFILQGSAEITTNGSLFMKRCKVYFNIARSKIDPDWSAFHTGPAAFLSLCDVNLIAVESQKCDECGLRYIFRHPDGDCLSAMVSIIMES